MLNCNQWVEGGNLGTDMDVEKVDLIAEVLPFLCANGGDTGRGEVVGEWSDLTLKVCLAGASLASGGSEILGRETGVSRGVWIR